MKERSVPRTLGQTAFRFLKSFNPMFKSMRFEIVGGQRLTCAGCEQRVERLVKAMQGVRQARNQRIEVLFDSSVLDAATITERISEAGYQTKVVGSDSVIRTQAPTTPSTRSTGREEHVSGNPPPKTARKWLSAVASALASVVGIVCPMCIPAVGAFLASIGLGFAVRTSVLQPLLIGLLAANLAALVWSVKLHRRGWVIVTGAMGAAMIYAGRYVWFSEPLLWAGAATLIGTSMANFKIKRACCRGERQHAT